MDKKTLVINLFLVFLICVIGISFAGYVILSNQKPSVDVPKEEVFVFDSQSVLSKSVNKYNLDFSLNYQGQDYFYSGTVDNSKKRCDFIDNDTEEKISVSYCDFYHILQKNISVSENWNGDSISISISEDFDKYQTFFQDFFGFPFRSSSLSCEIFMLDTGFISDSICSFGNSKIKASFSFEE